MKTGKTIVIKVVDPKKEESPYVPNPVSPSRVREIERKITTKEKEADKQKEKVPA